MTKRALAAAMLAAGFVLAGSAASARAQDGASSAAPSLAQENGEKPVPTTGHKPVPTTGSVDVERLPIDLERIQRKLNKSRDIETREGLNLRYLINVYGQAPPLPLFPKDENFTTGPVPWGAPTHQEIINQITPQQFRPPFMDFGALMRWLKDRDKEKK